MPFLKSWLGWVLAGVYIAAAIPMIYRAFHQTGGWISLTKLDVAIITFPSSFTLGFLFEFLGWNPSYSQLGAAGYLDMGFHLLVTAVIFYALGYGIEWGIRRLLA